MSFVPGDRHRFGLVLTFPLADNLVLTEYYEAPYVRGLVRNDQAITRLGEAGDRGVRHPDAVGDRARVDAVRRQPAEGDRRAGVQPRALARSSSTSRPAASTSAASSSSTARPSPSAMTGAAILLVSAELDEVLELSDRIAVMYRGEIVALVDGPTAEREEIGLLMATGRRSIPAVETVAGRRQPRRRPPDGDGSPDLGPRRGPGRLDPARAAARLAPDHRLEPRDRKAINLLLPLVAYESLLQGASGCRSST